MIERYRVTSTSIKYAMDRQGVIQYQRGYGIGAVEEWNRVLRSLAGV